MKLYKIHPNDINNFYRQLNIVEITYSGFYVPCVLIFSGKINMERLIFSLEKAGNLFNFLFCRFKTKERNVYIEYLNDDPSYFMPMEFEVSSLNLEDIPDHCDFLLPQQVDPIVSNVGGNINDVPMIYFRVTQMQNGFSLGYYFNHAFLDQISLLSFLNNVCIYYNNDSLDKLIKPHLADLVSLVSINEIESSSEGKIDQQKNKENLGDVANQKLINESFSNPSACRVSFPVDKLLKFRQDSNQYISKNDIINAVISKIYASNKLLKDSLNFTLEFTYNMRKVLGLDEKDIGNIITTVITENLNVGEVRASNIADVAARIRSGLKKVDKYVFFRFIKKIVEHPEQMGNVFMESVTSPTNIFTTNVSDLNYNNVHFDDNPVVALKFSYRGCYLYSFSSFISFEKLHQEEIIAYIGLPQDVLNFANDLSHQLGIFNIRIINK